MSSPDNCYRVKMRRDTQLVDAIIQAPNAVIALEKAWTMAPGLLAKRLPWLLEGGITKPPPRERRARIEISTPRLLHKSTEHHL